MAKSLIDGDWVIFRIDNSGIKMEMPDGSIVRDIKKMGDFDSILNRMEKKMQSTTGNQSFRFNTGWRHSDASTGYQYQDVAVRREDYKNMIEVLKGFEANANLGSYGSDINGNPIKNTYLANSRPETAKILNFTRTIQGQRARAKMMAEASLAGGIAEESFTSSNPERMSASLIMRESEYNSILSTKQGYSDPETATANEIYNNTFIGTKIKQNNEKAKRKNKQKLAVQEEIDKYFREEEEANRKAQEEAIKQKQREEEEDKLKAKQWEDIEASSAYEEWEAMDKEASQKMKSEKKKIDESARRTTALIKGILSVTTLMVDLLRRILTATLKNASETEKRATESHAVNVSLMDRRAMDNFDIAHGLSRGATFGAISSVQGMFGDITRLDENAINTLARVMGGDVADLVRSGIGGSNPKALLEEILDKYFKQYKSGRNSLGQNVGQEQAKRELISSLKSVSPEIAELFSKMIEDATSGKYGTKIKDASSWFETTETNRTSLTKAEKAFSAEIGTKYNEILAIVDDLKDSFFTRLANSLDGLLIKIKGIKLFSSAENKIYEDSANFNANIEAQNILTKELDLYNISSQSKINELSSTSKTPLRGQSYDRIKNFRFNAQLLAGIASGIYDKDYLKDNFNNLKNITGMSNMADINEYIKRAKNIYNNAVFNPEVQDELLRSYVILGRLADIEKTNANEIGSGKILDYSLTPQGEDTLTIALLRKLKENIVGQNSTLDEFSSEQINVIKKAYADYLSSNPEAINEVQKRLGASTSSYQRGILSNINKSITSAKNRLGRNLTKEELADIVAENDAVNWYSYYFTQWQYASNKGGTADAFLTKNTTNAFANSLQFSDSAVLSRIASLIPEMYNTSINWEGRKNTGGGYTITVKGVDSSGKETFSDTYDLNDFSGKNMTGTFEIDSFGHIQQSTTAITGNGG